MHNTRQEAAPMRLIDRFPRLMLWHIVENLATLFVVKALMYWTAGAVLTWWGQGNIYSHMARPAWDVAILIAGLALLLRWCDQLEM